MSRSLRGLSQEGVRANSRYSGRILLSSAKRRPHAPVPGTERRHIDKTMVKAIARAFRWREMLENGTHATIAEIAAAEKINESYVGRILRLTLLAPDIVEAILGGRQPAQMTLAVLMRRFPVLWSAQRSELLHPA
jgi:hypothetical protein